MDRNKHNIFSCQEIMPYTSKCTYTYTNNDPHTHTWTTNSKHNKKGHYSKTYCMATLKGLDLILNIWMLSDQYKKFSITVVYDVIKAMANARPRWVDSPWKRMCWKKLLHMIQMIFCCTIVCYLFCLLISVATWLAVVEQNDHCKALGKYVSVKQNSRILLPIPIRHIRKLRSFCLSVEE